MTVRADVGAETAAAFDWKAMADALNTLLRLKTTVIGMKLFESVEAMSAVRNLRRPDTVHTADQIVGMAARLNWTVGVTAEDLVGDQCRTILGLGRRSPEWLEGKRYVNVWHATPEDAAGRQHALCTVPDGRYQGVAVSPLASGRLDPPDICLVYANPAQMIILINGLQWRNYQRFDWSVVGESSCADSWGRALATRRPSLSLPCFAERRYGGVPDDELLMALPPSDLQQAIDGMKALSSNGLRYPIPPYGVQTDARAGMQASYASPSKPSKS